MITPAAKRLLVQLNDVSKNDQPGDALDASINHLAMNVAVISKLTNKSRGEMKAMARRAFEDMLKVALENYSQLQSQGKNDGIN